jgi:hypothetical protein
MKKLVLFLTALLFSGALFSQTDCTDIFISEYVEGWYNNKSLELYNPTNAPVVLDNNYRLIRFDNGSTTSDQNPLYVLPLAGTIEPYKVLVMVQDTTKPGQDTMVWIELRKKATWLAPYDYNGTTPGGNVVFWNGDDAISLQKKQTNGTWKDIDIFGEIGVRPLDWQGGTTGAWTDTKPYWRGTGAYLTKDQTLIRKKSVKHGVDRITMSQYGNEITGIYPNSFNAFLEYDSMPANFFDSLGHHMCDCKTSSAIGKLTQSRNVTISPNPVINSWFDIQASAPIASVEVVSVVGQQVFYRGYAVRQRDVRVVVNTLPAGIYLVRVRFDSSEPVIRKIVVR